MVGALGHNVEIFVYDRLTQTTESIASDYTHGLDADSISFSADSRYVSFGSGSPNLIDDDTNNTSDIFVYDRLSHTTERVSIGSDGAQAIEGSYQGSYFSSISGSYYSSISADGRFVAFQSLAPNLVAEDTNDNIDIFVYDRLNHTTERVSIATDGTEGNGSSLYPSISGDGRYVVFTSNASNLVSGDTNGETDTFIYDRVTETITRVVANDGVEGNGSIANGRISQDGQFLAVMSVATNLVSGDTNGFGEDIFVINRALLPPDNQAPTAVALYNVEEVAEATIGLAAAAAIGLAAAAMTSIAENTLTTDPIKMADIVVTDDGLGTNILALTGAEFSGLRDRRHGAVPQGWHCARFREQDQLLGGSHSR